MSDTLTTRFGSATDQSTPTTFCPSPWPECDNMSVSVAWSQTWTDPSSEAVATCVRKAAASPRLGPNATATMRSLCARGMKAGWRSSFDWPSADDAAGRKRTTSCLAP
ncbi:unnamed protein product, partial [Nesidiocoris tenuis]